MTINTDQEYVLCAAIWYKDLPITRLLPTNLTQGTVVCGHRHPHCIAIVKELADLRSVITEVGSYTQGFLTSKNRFVDRKEGAIIFQSYGGVLKYSSDTLYSEDLY
jgi:hypothetical protein